MGLPLVRALGLRVVTPAAITHPDAQRRCGNNHGLCACGLACTRWYRVKAWQSHSFCQASSGFPALLLLRVFPSPCSSGFSKAAILYLLLWYEKVHQDSRQAIHRGTSCVHAPAVLWRPNARTCSLVSFLTVSEGLRANSREGIAEHYLSFQKWMLWTANRRPPFLQKSCLRC